MYYVYILQSSLTGELYTGSTEDLRKRFQEHNQGKTPSTRLGRPWKLLYYEAYHLKELARKTELFYKTGQGRRQIKKKLNLL